MSGINLKKLRFDHNLSQEELGSMLGVTKQHIGRMESGKANITQAHQKRLLELYPELQNNICQEENTIPGDYYPDVFASCGSGCCVLSETKEPVLIPKKCFKKPFSKVKKYSVIVARGNSMEPTIYDNDRLIVEHIEPGEQIKDNAIYVFGYGSEIYVKRLIKNIDELIIKSDNIDPVYKTKFIQKEEMNNIVIIGEIVGLMRDFR